MINRRFPDHIEEFDIAIHTGMRKSEQYGKPRQKEAADALGLNLPKRTGPTLVREKSTHPRSKEWQGGLRWIR